jgi:hypothetical protein
LKYIVLYALFIVVAFSCIWSIGYFDFFGIIMNITADEAATNQAINDWSAKTSPALILIMFASVGLWVIYASAVWRKMLRGEEIGFHGLTWGKDENRLAFAYLIYYGLNMGASLVFVFAILFGAAIIGGLALIAPSVAAIIGAILVIFAMFASVWFYIRISQFGVLTIATRKMATIDSFKETRGHFWSFFGAHFIQGFLVSLVFMIFFALLIWSEFGQYFETNQLPTEFPPIDKTKLFLFLGGFALFGGFASIAHLCVGAYAYKIMHDGEEMPSEPEPLPHVWPTLGE